MPWHLQSTEVSTKILKPGYFNYLRGSDSSDQLWRLPTDKCVVKPLLLPSKQLRKKTFPGISCSNYLIWLLCAQLLGNVTDDCIGLGRILRGLRWCGALFIGVFVSPGLLVFCCCQIIARVFATWARIKGPQCWKGYAAWNQDDCTTRMDFQVFSVLEM